jgi:DNA-binding transcriptional regulator YhcF (GntR family)
MQKPFAREKRNDENEDDKVSFSVIKKIRNAILEETFKPADHLVEVELAEMFEASRSPVREALLALEKEGTVVMEPYRGAIVKPVSPQEAFDIAEIRLDLISLALKSAYRRLSPADFDSAYGPGKTDDPEQDPQRILRIQSPFLGRHLLKDRQAHFVVGVQGFRRPVASLYSSSSHALPGAGGQAEAARDAHRTLPHGRS